MRIGFVLGAGGATGHGFHTGVLAALADVAGIEAHDAALLVGTSAGSMVECAAARRPARRRSVRTRRGRAALGPGARGAGPPRPAAGVDAAADHVGPPRPSSLTG